MLAKLPCFAVVFMVLCAVGFSQPKATASEGSKDYSKVCGVNLVLEQTLKRRSGELDSEFDPEDPAAFARKNNFSAAEQHPWVISYGIVDDHGIWKHVCGGSIISPSWVLTAHHCVHRVGDRGKVRAGDSNLNTDDGDQNLQIRQVQEIHIHPFRNKDSSSAFFDLAVLRVDPPFQFTDSVRQICLPKVAKINADDREGQGVTVAGYGETTPGAGKTPPGGGQKSSGELLSTSVAIRPEAFCKRIYESAAVNKVRQEKKRSKRSEPVAPRQPTPEEVHRRLETAAKIIPVAFNTSIMCIGSEIGGIGACEGDDGGPGYIFDTGDGINDEKFVQISLFHGSVECGLASYPDIHVRLEDPETHKFLQRFLPGGDMDRSSPSKANKVDN